jgi:lysophospholipase L1-like esterase
MPTITRQSDSTTATELTTDRSSWLNFSAQFLFLTVIAIILLEVLFRLWGVGAEIFVQPDQVLGCHHIPNKLVIWRCEGYSQDHFNSFGLRDYNYPKTKPANTKRIAVLGDSTTEGLQVSLEKTYPKVLEKLLNRDEKSLKYEVLNFACSSYSTGQELLQYQQQVLKYNPDIIILLYNMGDAQENALHKEPELAEARPYFAIDKNNCLFLDDRVLKINKCRLITNPVLDFLSAHSRIFGVLAQTNFSQTLSDSRYRKFSNWLINIVWPKAKYSAPAVAYDNSELEVTKAIILELKSEIKKHGQQFVLMTYPCLAPQSQYFSECKTLSKLGQEENFPVLDLSAAFTSYPSKNSLFYAYHLSSTGHQLVASHLAYVLGRQGLIK